MRKWFYETYWSLRVLNAYCNIELAYKHKRDPWPAKREYVKCLRYLGRYDFSIAELALYTSRRFEKEEHMDGWI